MIARTKRSIIFGIALVCVYIPFSAAPTEAADDNLLAHKLYRQGRFTQAAEIFTDPAWKGISLYRSEQWWRAAEAFIRADDALSAYNLGNCYVKLGYFALALDAYQRALSGQPDMEDAEHNAALMRTLLAQDNSAEEQSGRQPSEDEIDNVDSDEKSADAGVGEGGSEQSSDGEPATGELSEGENSRKTSDQTTPGDEGTFEDEIERSRHEGSGDAAEGSTGEADPANRSSGEAEGGRPADASQAAGLRTAIEDVQATEQWLNQIQHDPQRFLEKRIKLELRRRQAAGQSAPKGGSVW